MMEDVSMFCFPFVAVAPYQLPVRDRRKGFRLARHVLPQGHPSQWLVRVLHARIVSYKFSAKGEVVNAQQPQQQPRQRKTKTILSEHTHNPKPHIALRRAYAALTPA